MLKHRASVIQSFYDEKINSGGERKKSLEGKAELLCFPANSSSPGVQMERRPEGCGGKEREGNCHQGLGEIIKLTPSSTQSKFLLLQFL